MSERIKAFLAMLERGQDSAVLRFSLGNEYLSIGEHDKAAFEFGRAVEFDENYSAAWKLLGRTRALQDRDEEAMAAYRRGIKAAEQKGDRQAAKEMTVFLKRLQKNKQAR